MLPDGFSDLVGIIVQNWDWDVLPKKDTDVWDALLYTVFLGATVRSAQANYAKEVFGTFLDYDKAKAVLTDANWRKKALKIVDTELRSIHDTPGEGFKRAILQIAIHEIDTFDLSRTIGDSLKFFSNYKICANKIKSLENDRRGSLDLIASAAHEIHNVRYIKGVLWLYNCGIAKEIVPPNAHVTRFLNECGYPGFGWSRDIPEDWQIFTIACNKMSDVAKQVAIELNREISPKQAQAAVWYLQTCRGLLDRNTKKKLTPNLLLAFLKNQKWSINQLNGKLGDVEELEDVTKKLKDFLG